MCRRWTRWSKKIWRKISDSESKTPTQGVCICLPENEIFNDQLFLYFSSQQNNKKMQAEGRIPHTLLVGRGFFLYKSTHIFFLGNITVTPCDPCDWVVAPRRVIARYGNVGRTKTQQPVAPPNFTPFLFFNHPIFPASLQKHVLLVGKILSSSLETEKGCFGLRAADFEKIYYGRLDRPRKRVGIRDLLIQDGSELLLANVRSQEKETDKMGLRLSFPP